MPNSLHHNFPLPIAESPARRLADIQAVREALTAVDLLLHNLRTDLEAIPAVPSNVATLNAEGKLPQSQIPSDIYTSISSIQSVLSADDVSLDTLQEVIELLRADGGLIQILTVGKLNASDVVDNLTTDNAAYPLAAAQGVVLKGMINNLQSTLAVLQASGGSGGGAVEEPTAVNFTFNDEGSVLTMTETFLAGDAVTTYSYNSEDSISSSVKTYSGIDTTTTFNYDTADSISGYTIAKTVSL